MRLVENDAFQLLASVLDPTTVFLRDLFPIFKFLVHFFRPKNAHDLLGVESRRFRQRHRTLCAITTFDRFQIAPGLWVAVLEILPLLQALIESRPQLLPCRAVLCELLSERIFVIQVVILRVPNTQSLTKTFFPFRFSFLSTSSKQLQRVNFIFKKINHSDVRKKKQSS